MQGHAGLVALTESAGWLGISVITALEFSGFTGLTSTDQALFEEFASRVEVIGVNYGDRTLIGEIAALRRTRTVKLPGAIILATAAANHAVLITRDDQLLRLGGAAAGVVVEAFGTG